MGVMAATTTTTKLFVFFFTIISFAVVEIRLARHSTTHMPGFFACVCVCLGGGREWKRQWRKEGGRMNMVVGKQQPEREEREGGGRRQEKLNEIKLFLLYNNFY